MPALTPLTYACDSSGLRAAPHPRQAANTPPPPPPSRRPPPVLTDSWGGVASGPVVAAPQGGGPAGRQLPPPPQGASGQQLAVKVPAQGADGRPIVHKHQKHYPERLTWGEHLTRHGDLAVWTDQAAAASTLGPLCLGVLSLVRDGQAT